MKKDCLEIVRGKCNNCHACVLGKTRNNIVFSDGNPETAKIVLIGEAPGETEDMTGTPFVGRAGKLLTEFLAEAGISRKDDVYIINTVKCRPPENRVPTNFEKKCCEDYLMSQIAIINPKVIILCGATACQTFFNETFWKKNKISNLRGDFFESQGIQFVPVFHPYIY